MSSDASVVGSVSSCQVEGTSDVNASSWYASTFLGGLGASPTTLGGNPSGCGRRKLDAKGLLNVGNLRDGSQLESTVSDAREWEHTAFEWSALNVWDLSDAEGCTELAIRVLPACLRNQVANVMLT